MAYTSCLFENVSIFFYFFIQIKNKAKISAGLNKILIWFWCQTYSAKIPAKFCWRGITQKFVDQFIF